MRTNVTPMKPDADNGSCPAKIRRRGPATAEARTELPVTHGDQHGKAVTTTRPERRFPRAMSDQDRRHSVTDAALCRGARSPDPGAVRLAGHMGGRGQHRQALPSIRPEVSHWKGPAPCDQPPIAPPYRWIGEPRCLPAYATTVASHKPCKGARPKPARQGYPAVTRRAGHGRAQRSPDRQPQQPPCPQPGLALTWSEAGQRP